MASDAHLVARLRDGQAAAFEAMYDRHSRAILSFCRHMLGSVEEAEDAVQHTFLAAYNDIISTHKPIQLRPWLFTIARNRCYSILRARREHPLEQLGEAPTEGLAAQVQRRQDLRDLVGDMRRLPDDQRAALVLSEMDALSHEQIGDVLGIPKDKVKALVFQARESLVASRAARETDCAEIREQLANLRGGALRRANLRRHLRDCAGCREFRAQIDHQRRLLKVLLPVVPAIGLRQAVLGATIGGGTGGGFGGGLIAGGLFKTGALKSIMGAMLAGVGAAGTYVVVHELRDTEASPFSGLPKLVQKAPFTPAPAPAFSSGLGSMSFANAVTRNHGGHGDTFVALKSGGAALPYAGGGAGRNVQRAVSRTMAYQAGAPRSHASAGSHYSPAPPPAAATSSPKIGPLDPGGRVSDGHYGSSGSALSPASAGSGSSSGSGGAGSSSGPSSGLGPGNVGPSGSGAAGGQGTGGSGSGSSSSGSGYSGGSGGGGPGGQGGGSGGQGGGSGGQGGGSGGQGGGHHGPGGGQQGH